MDVVLNRVNNLDFERAVGESTLLGQVEIRQVHGLVRLDLLGNFVNLVGHVLRRRSTVVAVKLDAEIIVGSSRVVRGRKKDTAVRLSGPDQGRGGGRGEDGLFTDEDLLDSVTGSKSEDDLRGFGGLRGRGERNERSLQPWTLTKYRPSPPTTRVLPAGPPSGIALRVA